MRYSIQQAAELSGYLYIRCVTMTVRGCCLSLAATPPGSAAFPKRTCAGSSW